MLGSSEAPPVAKPFHQMLICADVTGGAVTEEPWTEWAGLDDASHAKPQPAV